MQEFLYIFNYPPYEKELCELEFQCLFHQNMNTKYLITTKDIDFYRSVFIRSRITILKRDHCFDNLITFLHEKQLTYYDFKVIYLKNEITHVPYKETIEKCKQIALPINGSVSMQEPKVIIIITKIKDDWILGIQHINDQWHQHENKPYTYSSSISLRIARTLVNIGVENDLSLTVVDPCCGIGTVVLEALSMGIKVKGYDISRDVSYQARLNLKHFHYDPLVIEKKDMHQINELYDVCILDIPYGLYSQCTYQQQIELLKSTTKFTKKLVLVSTKQMDKVLEGLGYHLLHQCKVGKNESFEMVRYISVGIKE